MTRILTFFPAWPTLALAVPRTWSGLGEKNVRIRQEQDLLGPVLLLLPLLAAAPGLSLDDTLPQQPEEKKNYTRQCCYTPTSPCDFPLLRVGLGCIPVLGLELLGEVHGVVDEGEPSGLATTELCLEPKGEAAVGGAGVHLGQLLPHLQIGVVQCYNRLGFCQYQKMVVAR